MKFNLVLKVTSTPQNKHTFHHPTVCLPEMAPTLRALVKKTLYNEFRIKTLPTSTDFGSGTFHQLSGESSQNSHQTFQKTISEWLKLLVHLERVFVCFCIIFTTGLGDFHRVWWFMLDKGMLGFWIPSYSLNIVAGSNLKTWISEWSVYRWALFPKSCLWQA